MRNVFEVELNDEAQKVVGKINEGITVFDDDDIIPKQLPNAPKGLRKYIPWGDDNNRPVDVVNLIKRDEVMSPNMYFNIQTVYGTGLTTSRKDGNEIYDKDILDFFMFNRSPKYLLEQATDLKHFFFSVAVIILNRKGDKIVQLRHKDAMFCRFEECNPKTGAIEHVIFGTWDDGTAPDIDEREIIEVLDIDNPLGDLLVRMGKMPNAKGIEQTPTKTRKFALINKIPIPGNKYYPHPYYWAIFNSGWYDVKQMIPGGKKAKFKNGLVMKYQVEINAKYWDYLFEIEQITDPVKKKERMNKEKENIRDFLTGMVNAGKVWFSGFYIDPNGKEQSMVRINVINTAKEGGDWIEDVEEGSSMMCYSMGVHPSAIGATPGKSSSNLNGSNIREIFTMKQALEKSAKDIILEPYYVIAHFNNWDIKFDIPIIMLTTLDQHTDAVEKSSYNTPSKK
jgi:hypothetical protein